MNFCKILLRFLLALSMGGKVWAADLVVSDQNIPEPPPAPVTTQSHTDHTNCGCGARSHEAVHGPSKIPLAKIVEIEKVKPASATPVGRVNSGFNWGTLLAIGAGAAIGIGVGYLGYKLLKDSSKDDYSYPPPGYYPPPSYLPPVPPPVAPYYYGYRPPYYFGGNPPPGYMPANPSYYPQPALLGPPPAVLPPIYPQSVGYPLYPQQNYFGTQIPLYYPTFNYSGVPLSI